MARGAVGAGLWEGTAVQAVCDAMEISSVAGRWVTISEVTGPGVTSDVRKPNEMVTVYHIGRFTPGRFWVTEGVAS